MEFTRFKSELTKFGLRRIGAHGKKSRFFLTESNTSSLLSQFNLLIIPSFCSSYKITNVLSLLSFEVLPNLMIPAIRLKMLESVAHLPPITLLTQTSRKWHAQIYLLFNRFADTLLAYQVGSNTRTSVGSIYEQLSLFNVN